MGLRKSLRKVASDFFPAGAVHSGETDPRPPPPRLVDKSAVCVDVAHNQAGGSEREGDEERERKRLSEFELGLGKNEVDDKGRRASWYCNKGEEKSQKPRVRNKLVKRNAGPLESVEPSQTHVRDEEAAADTSSSTLAANATPVRRSRSRPLKRTIDSFRRCRSKDVAHPNISRNEAATPESRLVSMPVPESKQASNARHTDDNPVVIRSEDPNPLPGLQKGRSLSVGVPRRLLSMKDSELSPPTSFSISPTSSGSGSDTTVRRDRHTRPQSSAGPPSSADTSRTSTFSSFRAPKKMSHRRVSCDASLTAIVPSDHLGRTFAMESAPTLKLPSSYTGRTPSPMLTIDTELTSSFVLRDSWCDPEKISMVLEKAGESSLRQASPTPGGGKDKLGDDHVKSSRDAMPNATGPQVPNFSHPSSQVTTETPRSQPGSIFLHQNIASSKLSLSLENNAPSATPEVKDAQSISYFHPLDFQSRPEIPAIPANRHGSCSTNDSRAVEQWLEPSSSSLPTPPLSAYGSGAFHRFSFERAKERPKSTWSITAMMPTTTEEDCTPPASPTQPRLGSMKTRVLPPPLPTKEEMHLALLRSLSIPLPPSPANTSHRSSFSSSSLSGSFLTSSPNANTFMYTGPGAKANGKPPVHVENSIALSPMPYRFEGISDTETACIGNDKSTSLTLSRRTSSTNTSREDDGAEHSDHTRSTRPNSPLPILPPLSPKVSKHRKSYSSPSVSANTMPSLVPPNPNRTPGQSMMAPTSNPDPIQNSRFLENFDTPPRSQSQSHSHLYSSFSGSSTTTTPDIPNSLLSSPVIPMRVSSLRRMHRHERSVSAPWSMAPDLSTHPAFKQRVDDRGGKSGNPEIGVDMAST